MLWEYGRIDGTFKEGQYGGNEVGSDNALRAMERRRDERSIKNDRGSRIGVTLPPVQTFFKVLIILALAFMPLYANAMQRMHSRRVPFCLLANGCCRPALCNPVMPLPAIQNLLPLNPALFSFARAQSIAVAPRPVSALRAAS